MKPVDVSNIEIPTDIIWEPKKFGIDKPLSRKELRKQILENLPPNTQKALFYVEEKGLSTDYQFSQLTGGEYSLTALATYPNGNIISGYMDGTIRIWDFKGICTKSLSLKMGGSESNRWSYESIRRLAVLPEGRIIIGENTKILERKGEYTATIALGKPEYKQLIIDSNPPSKLESGILYITVDEKVEQCDIRSTDIKTPIIFSGDHFLFSSLSELLRKPSSKELDLPQNIAEADRIREFNNLLKFNEPPNLTSLAVWNDRIVAGLDDKTIKVWQADGNFLVILSGHTTPVCALAVSSAGNLVSADGEGVIKFWDNDFKCVDTRLFGIKSIIGLKTFSNGTLVLSTNEEIFFWNKAHGYLPSFTATGPFAIPPDAQAILYASENIIKYVFVGTPMLLNFSFRKELLIANAKLHTSNQTLMVKTIQSCSEGLIGLGAVLQNLCGEFQLNIEFAETELRILNLTDLDLMTDLENLCQLFGAAKFISAPELEVKKSVVLPLISSVGLIGSQQGQEVKKDNKDIQIKTHLTEIKEFCHELKFDFSGPIGKVSMLKSPNQLTQAMVSKAKLSCKNLISRAHTTSRFKTLKCIHILLHNLENLVTGSPLEDAEFLVKGDHFNLPGQAEARLKHGIFSLITSHIPEAAKIVIDYLIVDKTKLNEFYDSELQPLICSLEKCEWARRDENTDRSLSNITFARIILSGFFDEEERLSDGDMQYFLKASGLPSLPGKQATMEYIIDLLLKKQHWRYYNSEKFTFSDHFKQVMEIACGASSPGRPLFGLAEATNILERLALLLKELSPTTAFH